VSVNERLLENAGALAGRWSAPPDGAAIAACACGFALIVLAVRPSLAARGWTALFGHMSRARFAWGVGLAASVLSLGYAAHYLRGGPRIIDATTYWLQARSLAHGHFGFDVPEPTASFRGRFLIFDGHRAFGVFPPGYPLLLSLGFLVGAPMIIGPLLAAALARVTASLARTITGDARAARLAAVLSVTSAALRYHTADTMAHGAAALGVSLALLFTLRARSSPDRAIPWVLAGLALGWVLSTRVASSLGVGLVALGSLPGVLLLLASQKAATGSFFQFAQYTYYERSDGPPGCFRWGFGQGIGCVVEHADFVAARLPDGYGPLEAIGTTLRRLHLHATDVLNGWPLALLVLPGVVRAGRAAPAVGAAILLHVLAYAPFYFDGNYPGGGARLFADVLPLEHALIAAWVVRATWATFEQRALALLGTSLALFGVHAVHGHLALRDRDGGRPMFDQEQLAQAGLTTGLLYVDTDHGFALGHTPGATVANGVVVARRRDDDHDRLLWERLGHPPTFAYGRDTDGPSPVRPFLPPAASDVIGHEAWRFEGESDWPPLTQSNGWAWPRWESTTCASGGRVLELVPTRHPGAPTTATVTVAIPSPRPGAWRVSPSLLRRLGDGTGALTLRNSLEILAHWELSPPSTTATCVALEPLTVTLSASEITLELEARDGPVALDKVVLTPPPP
jgi:hypothetical protein